MHDCSPNVNRIGTLKSIKKRITSYAEYHLKPLHLTGASNRTILRPETRTSNLLKPLHRTGASNHLKPLHRTGASSRTILRPAYRTLRKLASLAFAAAIILGIYNPAAALPRTIGQTSELEILSTGVTLEKVRRLTDNGWLNFNVLRADLNDPYIYADTITDDTSIQNLFSPLTAAKNKNAIATVNGSFFMWTDVSNKVVPIGLLVENGVLKTSYMDLNNQRNNMASLSINYFDEILCNFIKTEMWLESKSGITFAARYNRPYYGYTDLTVLDRTWDTKSPGSLQSDTVEMVVTNSIVTEIRQGLPSITIPENGFVVVSKGTGANTIRQKFSVGDSIEFKVITGPVRWDEVKMAITGGSLLVNNGSIPASFSHSSPGLNPRTAIGTSKTGKELIILTVDGRSDASLGVTQYELAELMIQLGAYSAINLDGGGSTAMIARLPGELSPQVINKPSDGSVRRVASAVGIFSNAPKGPLSSLIIECEDRNMFAGTSRTFTVKGVDRYFNPVSVNSSSVVWGASGLNGYFQGNTFHAKQAGTGTITATYGGITSHYLLNVMDTPARIIPSRSSLELFIGESRTLTFKGADISGTIAPIKASDLNYSVTGNPAAPGNVTNGVFKAANGGSGYITASVGNTKAHIRVDVPAHWTLLNDDFEYHNGTFSGYPSSVMGSYTLSAEQHISGWQSGKLVYDFRNNTEETRAAYLEFTQPIPMEATAVKLALDVYNTVPNTSRVRAELIDTDGRIQRLELSPNLNWRGWKHLEIDIDGFTPRKLTRIYIVQTSDAKDSGTVYFENLTTEIPVYDIPLIVPADTMPPDADLKSVQYTETPQSFRFSVFSMMQAARNPLERVIESRMSEKINSTFNASALLGKGSAELRKLVNTPQVSSAAYSSVDIKNSRLISLDTSGRILTGNKEQWHWLKKQVQNPGKSNIFIFMDTRPDDFADAEEGALFKNLLSDCAKASSLKIWVFYGDMKNSSYMESGVKYISFSSFGPASLKAGNPEAAQYALVTVDGNSVTYEFRPVIE